MSDEKGKLECLGEVNLIRLANENENSKHVRVTLTLINAKTRDQVGVLWLKHSEKLGLGTTFSVTVDLEPISREELQKRMLQAEAVLL